MGNAKREHPVSGDKGGKCESQILEPGDTGGKCKAGLEVRSVKWARSAKSATRQTIGAEVSSASREIEKSKLGRDGER